MAAQRGRSGRLPPEVNRCIFVKNLPFEISADEMYDIFGKFGAIRQIRLGTKAETRGKAFVVYEDIYDAKNAVDHLSGFNVCGRYIIVLYHQPKSLKLAGRAASQPYDLEARKQRLEKLKSKYGVTPGHY